MIELPDWLNVKSYQFRARVRPVLFVSVPVALAVWAWTQAPLDAFSWLLSLLAAAGVHHALGEKAADRGRARQEGLWASWGGAPTTQLLRHRDGTLNPYTLRHIHEQLARLCPDLSIPTPADEEADPDRADAIYAACVDRLRVYTRERPREFPNVLDANAEYGRRRNLWAIWSWGVAVALLAIIAASIRLYVSGPETASVVALAGSVGFLGWIAAVVRSEWVREAAFLYAHRLLEAVDRIPALHVAGE